MQKSISFKLYIIKIFLFSIAEPYTSKEFNWNK